MNSTISAYLYQISPVDGLPCASRNCASTSFLAADVVSWHVSRQYGDGTSRLGAKLRDGRLVFVVRSELAPELTRSLNKIADRVRRIGTYSGCPRTIGFYTAAIF